RSVRVAALGRLARHAGGAGEAEEVRGARPALRADRGDEEACQGGARVLRMMPYQPGARATGSPVARAPGRGSHHARISRIGSPPWLIATGRPDRSGTVMSGSMPRHW